jgi:folate-dependent phosphoribosylglycinamide formyltransferase PurN
VRIYLLLAEDLFYTLPLVKSIVENTEHDIVGVAFPAGFINLKRIPSTLLIYGIYRFIKTALLVLYWKVRNGGKVAHYLQKKGIDIKYVKKINSAEFVEHIDSKNVDLLISNNCPQKLKKRLLNVPNKGSINLHLGLLPAYRGVFPIFHALINDEKEIGVTVHYMDELFDNGLIITQKTIPVMKRYDLFDIYPLAFKVGAELLVSSIDNISKGTIKHIPNGLLGASYYSYPTLGQISDYRRKYQKFGIKYKKSYD